MIVLTTGKTACKYSAQQKINITCLDGQYHIDYSNCLVLYVGFMGLHCSVQNDRFFIPHCMHCVEAVISADYPILNISIPVIVLYPFQKYI